MYKLITICCNNCGRAFDFTPRDIEEGRTSTGNVAPYVECPYCDNPQNPWKQRRLRTIDY